ncbi:MAG: MurR/RpiR family transcriptional regulator, partial [Erysipelotrichaceae bacterium]|nr:MurR/RpiR family transcriptional regulator [Erysipelotrichaceae bacterium]
MTIIEKLKEQKDFTDAEQALANYILNNIGDISKLTIYQLSENSFCSVATISRFCKKLKINNFSLFKVELAKEVSEKEDGEQAVEHNHPFDKDDSEEDIARKVRHLTRHAVMDAYNNLDYSVIHEAAVMLDEAEIIDVYGNWISMTHAINLHSKLLWMGKNSSLEPLRGFQHVKAKISNEKHLAVIISYYG